MRSMLISTLRAMFQRLKINALVTSRHEFVQMRRSNCSGKLRATAPGPSFGLMGPRGFAVRANAMGSLGCSGHGGPAAISTAELSRLIAAVKDGVTLGEVCDVYREEFGIYRDPAWV